MAYNKGRESSCLTVCNDTGGMNVKGIFISHSAKNRELVEQFVEFLKLGTGIENSRIFCTPIPEKPVLYDGV